MKTSTKITLAILSLPFTAFVLFYAWVQLFGHPVHDYVDALGIAALEMKQYCNEEKLDPCDFKLVKSSVPEVNPWKFTFYSKTYKKTKYFTEWITGSRGFMER